MQAFASQFSGGSNAALAEGFAAPPRTLDDWQEQVATALHAKQAAAEESRRRRIDRRTLLLRTELARRSGQPTAALRPPTLAERCVACTAAGATTSACHSGGPGRSCSPEAALGWQNQWLLPLPLPPIFPPACRQQVQQWRRRRSFVVLVAEDRASGELLGSATVSLAQPEAALPPPFPTSKPRRVYVSNIAVLPRHRRRGVASALLAQSERQARLWRRDSLWLHCELSNKPALEVGGSVQPGGDRAFCSHVVCEKRNEKKRALSAYHGQLMVAGPAAPPATCAPRLQLYHSMGYQEVRRDPMFSPNRRCLMRKDVPACGSIVGSRDGCTSSGASSGAFGATNGGGGGGGGGGGASGATGGSGGAKSRGGTYDWSHLK